MQKVEANKAHRQAKRDALEMRRMALQKAKVMREELSIQKRQDLAATTQEIIAAEDRSMESLGTARTVVGEAGQYGASGEALIAGFSQEQDTIRSLGLESLSNARLTGELQYQGLDIGLEGEVFSNRDPRKQFIDWASYGSQVAGVTGTAMESNARRRRQGNLGWWQSKT